MDIVSHLQLALRPFWTWMEQTSEFLVVSFPSLRIYLQDPDVEWVDNDGQRLGTAYAIDMVDEIAHTPFQLQLPKYCIPTLNLKEVLKQAKKKGLDSSERVQRFVQDKPLRSNYVVQYAFGIFTGIRMYFVYSIPFKESTMTFLQHSKVYDLNAICLLELSAFQYSEYCYLRDGFESTKQTQNGGLLIYTDPKTKHKVVRKKFLLSNDLKKPIEYQASDMRFLMAELNCQGESFSIDLKTDQANYYVVDNVLDATFMRYFIQTHHPTRAPLGEYTLSLLDNHVKRIQVTEKDSIYIGKTDATVVRKSE